MCALSARHGRGRRISRSHSRHLRMASCTRTRNSHGHHQRGNISRLSPRSTPAYRSDCQHLYSGWRSVFFTAGGIGVAWVLWWALSYRDNASTLSINTLDARLLAQELTFREIISLRQVQVLVFAKFMSDSAWFFLLFWAPPNISTTHAASTSNTSATTHGFHMLSQASAVFSEAGSPAICFATAARSISRASSS